MNNNTLKLISDLLTQYENSTYFKGGVSSRRVFLNDKHAFFHRVFNSNDAYKLKPAVMVDLNKLESKNLIQLNYDFHSNLIEIVLNIANADALYEELNLTNPKIELNKTLDYLEGLNYSGVPGDFVKDEILIIKTKFKTRKTYYSNIEQLDKILLCVNEIYKLNEETMERDFSSRVLGNSKAFGEYKSSVCHIIRDYDTSVNLELENDELLSSLYIVKNSTYAMIKNNLIFKLNNQIINLNDLGYEYLLDDKMINNLMLLPSNFKRVITIENLTSFKDYKDDDAVIIYLAGFHNHTKQMLLEKIYSQYPDKEYLHWGDIDVGGFRIFYNLKTKTHIPFKPYKMSINELKGNVNLLPLTKHDKESLTMMENSVDFLQFRDVISYMLEHNVKLEQENLD